MKKITYIFLMLSSLSSMGQYISGVTIPDSTKALVIDTNDITVKYANTITVADLRQHLSILAADDMEGRETGYPGNDKASQYLAGELNKRKAVDKVKNKSPYQNVAFTFTSWDEIELFVNGERYRHLWEFLSFPNKNSNEPAIIAKEVIFMGYGIDDPKYSDYNKANVSGKVIMINEGEPLDKNGNSRITGSPNTSEWSTNMDKKLELAKAKGVKLVLIITEDIKKMLGESRRRLLGPSIELGESEGREVPTANAAYISSNIAKLIIGNNDAKVIKAREKAMKKGKFKPVTLPTEFVINQLLNKNTVRGRNVIGFYPGSEKPEEIVVVSAHYDHIGKRGEEVFNGADDNGSGTTALLEILDAYYQARLDSIIPKRSVMFLWVTGEEKGLLGSKYYSENPIYDLDKTVVDINVDMVGRVDEKYAGGSDYVYVIGSDRLSSELHKINEEINSKYSGLTLDYTYNDENDPNRYYFRSDHYNFARKGIPAIFFFNGVHADYHQATDEVDKINFEMMAKRAKQIFHLSWELADREERIKVDGEIK